MKPAFKITVNGSDITEVIAGRLVQLAVTDEAGVNSDRVEIKLDDRDQRLSIPPTKATMTVEIGYQGSPLVDKGTFTIEDIELTGPERTMTLRGTSMGASKGAGASRDVSWNDTTLGKIAASIASRHGWKLAISKELADVQIDQAEQNENDLQFLSRLAAENDAVAKVANGRLVINPHASGKRVSGGEMPVVELVADQLTDWSMTIVERGNYAGVKATYYNLKEGDRGTVVDGEDTVNTTTLPHTFKDKKAAIKAAKSRSRALKRHRSTLSIYNMPGVAELRAETKANVKGLRAGVDGIWLINRVVHRLTDSGYTCAVDCETPQSEK
jgi:hypothetical protein